MRIWAFRSPPLRRAGNEEYGGSGPGVAESLDREATVINRFAVTEKEEGGRRAMRGS